MERTKHTVVPTLLALVPLLAAVGCQRGAASGSAAAWAEPLSLEGSRNETLALVAEETGVPLQVLYVLGYQQSRFEDPDAMDDHAMEGEVAEVEADLLGVEIPFDDERALEEPDLVVDDEDGASVAGLEDFEAELEADPSTDDFLLAEDAPLDASEAGDGIELPADGSAAEAEEESDPHFHPALAGVFLLTDEQRAEAVRRAALADDDIADDLEANARAAAAVLAAELERADVTVASATHRDWEDAMLRFVGFDPSEEGATFFRDDLRALLADGFDHVTSDGERLVMLRTGGLEIDLGDPWAEEEASPEGATGDTGVAVEEVRGYPAIEFISASSNNYSSRRGQSIRYVVIHDIEGTMPGAIATFRNPGRGASAHYIIRARDGHIVQMVPESANAWHCGHGFFNRSSIGIEHEGFANRPGGGGYYTERQYRASAELVGAIVRRYRIPVDRRHIFGHGNTPSSSSSTTLCSDSAANSGRCGGVSHHHDPGRYWNWRLYMGLVARYAGGSAPPPSRPATTTAPRPTELRAISTGWGGQRAVRTADGAVHVFGVDARYRLVETVRPAGGEWSGWRVVSSSAEFRGYPAAIVDGDRIIVAGRGRDNRVHLVRGTTGSWSAPIALDGLTINAMPSLFVNADGRAEVFVRGTNNELWHAAERSRGGEIGRWWSLGGELRTMPTVVADREGDPHVFAIGDRAGHVFHRERTSGTTWPSWRYLAARGNAPVSPILMPDGRLAVFTRDSLGRLVQQFQERAGGTWRPARTIGGRLTSNVVAVLDGRGRVNVFGRGRDAAVYRVVRNEGGRYGAFARLGGRVTMGPAPVLGPNGLEVFVAGRNHALYQAAQTRSTHSGWTGWRARGGRLGWL